MVCSKAEAAIETFIDSSSGLSGSATFEDIGGGKLQVTLVNTYTGDTPDQAHVLTGIFFSGANGLTPVSASAPAGSLQWVAGTSSAAPGSSVLGTEWAYASGSPAPGGATAGIVSAGYYSAVGTGNFAGPGDMLDGTAYGLVSAGYAGLHMGGLGSKTYIQNSMVFVLSGFSGPLNILNVGFQYGAMLTDPFVAGVLVAVPEPGTMAAGIFALVIFLPLVASQARPQTGKR
jgi:hypothetical protein